MTEPLNQIQLGMLQTGLNHYLKCIGKIMEPEVRQQYRQLIRQLYEMRLDGSVSNSAATLGRLGGQVSTKVKAKAARENGKLGGRPKLNRAPKYVADGVLTYKRNWSYLCSDHIRGGAAVFKNKQNYVCDVEHCRELATLEFDPKKHK